MQADENLNLSYHYKRLTLKALNRTGKVDEAAELLGITPRTLYKWKRDMGIYFDKSRNEYLAASNKPLIIR